MTIQYAPQDLQISFIMRWNGTIFPLVLNDPMFWLLLGVHVVLLYIDGKMLEDGGEGLPLLDWQASTVAMGLLTFFLVFYGNHCYMRYFELHGHCVAIGRQMMLWAHLVHLNFAHRSAATKWNMMRLMLGAMHLHYAFMRREEDPDGVEVQGVSTEEWRAMRRSNLFSRAEIATLQKYRGYRPYLAASWALNEVKLGILKDRPENPGGPAKSVLTTMPQLTIFNNFNAVVQDFSGHCSSIMEVLQQPVPFPYFHVLKLLLLLALLILSYALIELLKANVVLSLVCYVITCTIMIGLQQIAIGMSDPFGNDDVDFDIDGFLRHAYDNAVAKLLDTRQANGEYLSNEMENPLERYGQDLRTWDDLGVGLMDERPTPRGGDPKRPTEPPSAFPEKVPSPPGKKLGSSPTSKKSSAPTPGSQTERVKGGSGSMNNGGSGSSPGGAIKLPPVNTSANYTGHKYSS